MMRRILKDTPTEGLRSLTIGRHLAHDNWDQMHAYLSATLGPAHADLFAEPFRGSGTISWMASTPADALPFKDLPRDQQEQALTRLGALLGDISALAARRLASQSEADRQWGGLLQAIAQQPAKIDLPERLFVAGDQPVLVLWGCRDDATVSTESLLQETRISLANPAPPPAIPVAAVGHPAASGLVAPAAGLWWLPLLLWLLFVAALGLIYWMLLVACAVQLPWSQLGSCRQDPVIAEQQRHDGLMADLQRLRSGLTHAEQCKIPMGPSAAWHAPRPSLPPAGNLPGGPEPRIQTEETDLDRARDRAGGQVGDVTVTLLWNGRSDLDLLLICPNGNELAAGNSGSSICGGRVDVDANFCVQRPGGMGAFCERYHSPPVDNPVENAFFKQGEAMAGEFRILVRHFAAADNPATPVPYVLQVRQGDQRQIFEGTAQPGSREAVATFQID